ncbi:hypothetical protein TNCT_142041 [Trichonephila clavata]|uniref:Uncharacterized protein n=1 Tax=Trichonephila clavata TaxID=2740835 RepID=A0A8X6IH96_TRICU|nr:hypothetical protein TNCT_142041 [Trichonephila clavata]
MHHPIPQTDFKEKRNNSFQSKKRRTKFQIESASHDSAVHQGRIEDGQYVLLLVFDRTSPPPLNSSTLQS